MTPRPPSRKAGANGGAPNSGNSPMPTPPPGSSDSSFVRRRMSGSGQNLLNGTVLMGQGLSPHAVAQQQAAAEAQQMLQGGSPLPPQLLRRPSLPPFPASDAPPADMPRGGAEEIEWLRSLLATGETAHTQLGAQLQRVTQESHAMHSSLLHAQQNMGGASQPYEYDTPEAPAPNAPRMLQRRGTITNLLPPGQKPPTPSTIARKVRKRAPGALTDKGSAVDGDVEADESLAHAHPKSEELANRILSTLTSKAPFEGHEEADLQQLVAAMAPVEFDAGVDVLREGESGDLAYWVEKGSLTVEVEGKEVDTIQPDTVFGEVALIYDMPRTATVRAKTQCSMWLLHRATFQHILADHAIAERKAMFAFLKSVKIFSSLSGRQISRIADVLEQVTIDADEVIIEEGSEADSMYIIEQGQAVVSQNQPADGGADNEEGAKSLLRILKSGEYFGERALLHDGMLRSATVTAASTVVALRLDKHDFVELLGPLRAELIKLAMPQRRGSFSQVPSASSTGGLPPPSSPSFQRSAGEAGSQSMGATPRALCDTSAASSSTASGENGLISPGGRRMSGGFPPGLLRHAPPSTADLSLLTQLGTGGYGRVALVRHKKTRRIYALKRVCKDHLLAKNGMSRCDWMQREKEVLESLEHPFIVSLHATYADNNSIYLLLSAAMGGDLYRLIEKLGQVPEKVARFYVSSIVLALAHIHSQEVVYRDLKPENVLLDAQGYVKICDFGFAKKITDRTYTRCGTPDYTAPELLLNQGVNQACDWWAVGILIFEMLVGVPPFTDADGNDMKTYENITRGELDKQWPEDSKASAEARDLIQGLCTVKVAFRLGYLKGGADDVMAKGWFEDFDWDGLVNMTKEPPWRPRLESCDDTRCFDGAASSDSLDGPQGKSHGEDLSKRWTQLQNAYAPQALSDMSHLV